MDHKVILLMQNVLLSKKVDCRHLFNLALVKGEGLGVYGPNGAGKSTLLDSIAGIEPLQSGDRIVNGEIGYVLPITGIQEKMTCLENFYIEGFLCHKRKKEVDYWLIHHSHAYGIAEYLNKKVKDLSTGMRVRLMIALSMLKSPDLLLLDEAFNALDPKSVIQIKELLMKKKEEGLSLIFVSHQPQDFEGLCENLLELPSFEVKSL